MLLVPIFNMVMLYNREYPKMLNRFWGKYTPIVILAI